MNQPVTDSIVVGGGAIGMLTARELARAGQRVVLLERQGTGRESSWAGGGIVSPLFPWRYLDSVTALASWSQAAYPTICSELHDQTGIDPEYTRCGLVLVAADEETGALDWAARHGRSMERIDAARFAALEPAADTPAASALWMPEVAQVRNPRLVKALAAGLGPDIDLRTGTPVRGLVTGGGRCSGVLTDAGELHADNVVVCAGAWSGAFLGDLPRPPDIRPVRGQMLLFQTPPDTIRRMVLEENRYVIPRRDGHVLFGSTIEETGFVKETTAAARGELVAIACERFPVLADYPVVRQWAGLRPASPAGVPYIARHPEIRGLFVNAGHFRNGIVLGAASARLAADLVLGRAPILDPAAYAWSAARG